MVGIGEGAHNFEPYNGKVLDVNHGDTNKHTHDLSGVLGVNLAAVILFINRIAGAGDLRMYPNEGTAFFQSNGANPTLFCYVIGLAKGTDRIQVSQTVAGNDFDVYCMGYWRYET